MVCLPKLKGELRVLNLRIHKEIVQVKILHKFFNKVDISWVNLNYENIIQMEGFRVKPRKDPSGGETPLSSKIS